MADKNPTQPTTTTTGTGTTAAAATTDAPTAPSSFRGIDHLKLPAFDLEATQRFYTSVLPFTPMPQYRHYTPAHELFAVMVYHAPSNLLVEIRHVPQQAEAQRGWDPITFGVGTCADLEEWGAWLDHHGVKRSRVFTGIKGWVMGCEDPDGRIVRLHVQDEDHEWTDHPDQDDFWLGKIEA